MITANKIKITPTIFPDGTSQVWKLPSKLLDAYEVRIVWEFESEREIIDLLSLRRLLYSHPMTLHMPYLPYARQDKKVSNKSTFNLEVLADLLNSMRFSEVTSLDIHSKRAARLIKNFRNVSPLKYYYKVHDKVRPDLIVYPDLGASKRYKLLLPSILLNKQRNPLTGELFISPIEAPQLGVCKTVMIVDDICDGGATFLAAARALRIAQPNLDIHLFVTHGIFSKGLEIFKKENITVHCARLFKRGK
jgi:ribose-phosphate pyrophosphokinase